MTFAFEAQADKADCSSTHTTLMVYLPLSEGCLACDIPASTCYRLAVESIDNVLCNISLTAAQNNNGCGFSSCDLHVSSWATGR